MALDLIMSKNTHTREELLLTMYDAMLKELGPSAWWPASSPLEVAVGAVLTQNTSWTNVEKALALLKSEGLLHNGEAMLKAPREILEACIRPSGFFRLKTDRLRALLLFLDEQCGFDFTKLGPDSSWTMSSLREELLRIKGIGPETADSILLYAIEYPTFVIDAYTRRIFSRHGLVPEDVWYDELQAFFMDVLEPDVHLFNEYHALLVRVAKDFCVKGKPRCEQCPLREFLGDNHV